MAEVNLIENSKSKNVLHYFRSQTALFTIACLPETLILADQASINSHIDKFAIASSSGKPPNRDNYKAQVAAIDAPGSASYNLDVANRAAEMDNSFSFVTSDDGDYLNFYFDDVEVETLADFNNDTGFSKATKLRFNIIEPYSLSGFLQALQLGALKASYVSYISAPYVLRINFMGYPDWKDDGAPMLIEPASRYFIFRFTEVSVKSDESGTKYYCKAVPLNEYAFGQANKLLSNVTVEGDTVGKILEDFFNTINDLSKYCIGFPPTPSDTYEILFPTIESDGTIDESKKNDIYKALVADPKTDNVNYTYLNPVAAMADAGPPTKKNAAKVVSTIFNAGANIHDCIAGVIRDSEWVTKHIIKDLKIDSAGMVSYFNVTCTVVPKGWDERLARPKYIYKFKVIPHRIHYSRIPQFANKLISTSQLRKHVRRTYEYLYQGQNLDVLRFDLNFNYMYFQAIAPNAGVQEVSQGSSAAASTDASGPNAKENFSSQASIRSSNGNVIASGIDTKQLSIGFAGQNTRAGTDRDPYITLAKKLHAAILENVSQSQLELEILGDPYYLSHQGMNNFKPQADSSALGMTKSGDMDFQTGEIYIEIKFRNPVDINPKTGFMTFSNDITTYSGIYRIKTVVSRFTNGMFTQVLQLLKVERQADDEYAPNSVDPKGYDTALGSGGIYQDIAELNKLITESVIVKKLPGLKIN